MSEVNRLKKHRGNGSTVLASWSKRHRGDSCQRCGIEGGVSATLDYTGRFRDDHSLIGNEQAKYYGSLDFLLI
jgi:hypothetical protein